MRYFTYVTSRNKGWAPRNTASIKKTRSAMLRLVDINNLPRIGTRTFHVTMPGLWSYALEGLMQTMSTNPQLQVLCSILASSIRHASTVHNNLNDLPLLFLDCNNISLFIQYPFKIYLQETLLSRGVTKDRRCFVPKLSTKIQHPVRTWCSPHPGSWQALLKWGQGQNSH